MKVVLVYQTVIVGRTESLEALRVQRKVLLGFEELLVHLEGLGQRHLQRLALQLLNQVLV